MEHFELINTQLQEEEIPAGISFKKENKIQRPRDGKKAQPKTKCQKIFYADSLINSQLKELTLYYGKKESVLICELIKARHEEHIKKMNGEKVKEEMKDHTLQNFAAYQELSARFNELEKKLNEITNNQQPSTQQYNDKALIDRIATLETNLGAIVSNNQNLRNDINEAGKRKDHYKKLYEEETKKINNNGLFNKILGN